tara:strand:+ start:29 stop:1837 length:1809 start_codon:yes stop_codon:yes gene_type:complete
MAVINGAVSWGIVPAEDNNSNLATMSWDYRANYLKSANDQLRYQVQWFSSSINEATDPSAGNAVVNGSGVTTAGDVVNVVFKIESSVDGIYWNTIGTIKKSRDVANKKYDTNTTPTGHRFTIDVSQLVSDQLSYSLCPINKGTWQSNYYGGMNGGLTMQDNVIGGNLPAGSPISDYNVSDNGTFRKLKVSATFDIIDSNGNIIDATNNLTNPDIITVINSVNQYERDSVYYNSKESTTGSYTMTNEPTETIRKSFKFLSRCHNTSSTSIIPFKKPIRVDEEAEFLQFFMFEGDSDNIGGSNYNSVGSIGLKVETFLANGTSENTFYVREFEDNAILTTSTHWAAVQRGIFIQNISPSFINNAAVKKTTPTAGTFPYWNSYSSSTITTSTSYYRVSVSKFALQDFAERRCSEYRYYSIDRESENIPYGFVRFHWLNSMGGTDSYTAKRDVVEGLTISRDVIERKSGDRTWYQADSGAQSGSEQSVSDSSYISDTMRGGDIYKGGREVSSVNAERVQSVYTEPLNKSVAKWLEEMLLSPNVWIEQDTEATARGNISNPYLRPSTKEYIPVIITNSDAETVNQENGLVKFNIEYTLSHKVQTQRN